MTSNLYIGLAFTPFILPALMYLLYETRQRMLMEARPVYSAGNFPHSHRF